MISLMTSMTMMVLSPGYLVRFLFHYLTIMLVVSVDYFRLVESLKYFHLVESLEYFHLVKSLEYFHLVDSMKYFDLVESMEYFDLVKSFEYFLAQKYFSFKLRNFDIVALCFYLAHSYLRNFHNTKPRRDLVGVIHQPFCSGNRGEDRIDFVRCVDGR